MDEKKLNELWNVFLAETRNLTGTREICRLAFARVIRQVSDGTGQKQTNGCLHGRISHAERQ